MISFPARLSFLSSMIIGGLLASALAGQEASDSAANSTETAIESPVEVSAELPTAVVEPKRDDGTAARQELLREIAELHQQLRDLYQAELDESTYTGAFHQWLSDAAANPESEAQSLLRDLEDRSDDLAQVSRSMGSQPSATSRTRRGTRSPDEQEQIDSLRERLSDKLEAFQQDAPSLSDSERVERWNELRDLQAELQSLQSD